MKLGRGLTTCATNNLIAVRLFTEWGLCGGRFFSCSLLIDKWFSSLGKIWILNSEAKNIFSSLGKIWILNSEAKNISTPMGVFR